jgi:hypothetical protein
VAVITIDIGMDPYQWESYIFMELRDIFHNPGLGIMTSYTIIAEVLLVYIGMTGQTCTFCFVEFEGLVARPAIQISVSSRQSEGSTVMRKRRSFGIIGPVVGMVAQCTIHGKRWPVW